MNLSEALDAALPEIPKASFARSKPPMMDPDLIIREEVLDGEPTVGVLQREKGQFFRFPLAQWQLIQLFDGVRSYEEIAELYREQSNADTTAEELSAFAAAMEEQGFWYKTAQEKNLAMSERLMAQRGRRAQRTSRINVAHIYFSAWDPDSYFNWLDGIAGSLIYNRWSVLAVIALFIFEVFIFVAHWNVIGPDIPVFYSFTNKTFADFAEFWILLFILGFIHETAHGLTCKHFGGEVHSMGLMFLYLTPCFYVDVTETWIYASRVQRLWTIIAGIWIEMVVCGLAMIVWTNTASGFWLHDLMYKVILITGVAVVLMNLNPLLKLDGYYFLTEAIGIPELKERSTAFVSEWVQSKILRLPVEITPIPRNRVILFALYALLSGAYSYLVLFAVVRFSFNITYGFLAEFALIPAAMLAFGIFRSRLKSLKQVLTDVWRRNVHVRIELGRRGYVVIALVLLILFLPLWRDREDAFYVVEPANPTTVHAAIAGKVETVYVNGGQSVHVGEALLKMTSIDAATMHSEASALTAGTHFRSFEAQLQGQSIGTAAADLTASAQSRALSREVQQSLVVRAPSDGVVLNPDPDALLGATVASGQSLLSMADNGPRMVRIYIPYSALKRISQHAEVLIMPPGQLAVMQLHMQSIDGQAVQLPQDLSGRHEYKGLQISTFYSARIYLPSTSSSLPMGTAGTAKILGTRRSVAERATTAALDLVRRHVWW
ncbi:MAG: HlyD family efflux transporter periplasmic adaptor subunit [Acidobacteriota bacterium]|nr:HlyD family efflux transporter periplasmic adaptor subunit [Acidobacteriota bacterium]